MKDASEKALPDPGAGRPGTSAALQKRVRRHVIGPPHDFTAVVAPGLEACLARELAESPVEAQAIRTLPGRVAFISRLEGMYLASLHLRVPSRILMTLAELKAAHFHEFLEKTAAVPWELYLRPGSPLKFRVRTAVCRLRHTGAIAERLSAAIAGRFHKMGLSAEPDPALVVQQVFVHGEKDRFTLSLDASGDLLYRRGLKTHGGRAPIRETLAAGILLLAGYTPQTLLLDPMCGSGTFSLEAGLMARNLPPGAWRTFAFMQWPAFKPAQWTHLREKAMAAAAPCGDAPTIFASDISEDACTRLARTVDAAGLADTIQVAHADFFSLTSEAWGRRRGLVVINPPYGLRMDRPVAAKERIAGILSKIRSDFKGWRLAMVSPYRMEGHWGDLDVHRLSHGGLSLFLAIGRID